LHFFGDLQYRNVNLYGWMFEYLLTKEKKKLVFVLPSLKVGGMERVMSELAHEISLNPNIEINLILLSQGEKFYFLPEKVIIHEPYFLLTNRNKILYSLRLLFFLRSLINKINPDAILSFGEMYNSFTLLATLGLRYKVFVSDRSKPDRHWGKVNEITRKLLYPKAEGIVSQTKFSQTFLKKITGHQNIKVIPNPVNRVIDGNAVRKNIVLTVGRLIPSKKIDVLIKIFCEIDCRDWELWIVGDGQEMQNLQQVADCSNACNRIKFFGNQKDVFVFYKQARIFAFTSVSEGFPNALLEAQAAGLACISFDCIAGPADLIQNNHNGFLIPELQIDMYKNSLQQLMTDENLRKKFSINAAKSAQQFDIKLITDKYLNFILA
jgi:GalNAc-alpha-(1->4)-GalNAc-alpha-(1->3)-diNAcBac-PP-undecaprenol alpha-1,4-N-acetyl-D-galactosaminyltransferase